MSHFNFEVEMVPVYREYYIINIYQGTVLVSINCLKRHSG